MTAIVAEGERRKMFLSPIDAHVRVAESAMPSWKPRGKLPNQAMGLRVQGYGVTDWHQLFTERQLTVLTTLSDLLPEVHDYIRQEGADVEYADAICTYLALAVGRTAESGCNCARWHTGELIAHVFARQGIQMMWDFAEANPFSNSTQNWMNQIEWIAKAIGHLPVSANNGEVYQADACTTTHAKDGGVIITDPPYYDNIGYADLSDFFYVWLRLLLRNMYPNLFAGMTTPKVEEMVANKKRFENHNVHFEGLLGKALLCIRQGCSDEFPSSVFYAYKQQEEERDGKTSTGWETMLMAVVNAGFQIMATWPMRTESTARPVAIGKNALASSIVLVCRPRPADAPVITLRPFLAELKKAMPPALQRLTRTARISPVDLAQAAIGPGMEVYSRYSQVIRISGEIVPIREVLKAINDEITAYHEEESGALDKVTQFCLTWFKQHGYQEGNFGTAQVLATATGVDVASMHNKVLTAARGRVKLFRREDYHERELLGEVSAWEGCQRMAFHLSDIEFGGGIQACAAVTLAMGATYESAERLARVLYGYYEALDDAQSALVYNNLVQNWTEIWDARIAQRQTTVTL